MLSYYGKRTTFINKMKSLNKKINSQNDKNIH